MTPSPRGCPAPGLPDGLRESVRAQKTGGPDANKMAQDLRD
jgi:hypothetical protein